MRTIRLILKNIGTVHLTYKKYGIYVFTNIINI